MASVQKQQKEGECLPLGLTYGAGVVVVAQGKCARGIAVRVDDREQESTRAAVDRRVTFDARHATLRTAPAPVNGPRPSTVVAIVFRELQLQNDNKNLNEAKQGGSAGHLRLTPMLRAHATEHVAPLVLNDDNLRHEQ
jgi:hypothetical protein